MSRAIAAHHGAFGRAALLELDHQMAMHAHREGHLIFHVAGPRPSFSVAGQKFEMSPGRAAAISPLQPHDFTLGSPDAPVVTFVLYIDQNWFRDTGDASSLRFGKSLITLNESILSDIQVLVARMRSGEARRGLDESLFALTRSCFNLSWSTSVRTGIEPERPIARDNRIRKSINLMAERVGDDLSIDEIASDAGLSRPHFYRLFRENVGVTPNVYINTLRAETAIERLVTTNQAVTSIGLDLGFASQASFTRFFRANVGIPPTDYRRVALCA